MKPVFCVLGGMGIGMALLALGCSSSTSAGGLALNGGGTGGAGNGSGTGATGGVSFGGGTGGGDGGGINLGGGPSGGAGGGGAAPCESGPNDDTDKDGFTGSQGDCNDCDANANPGAYDVAKNSVDEDCNGTPDDAAYDCDQVINDVADNDAMHGAYAIGLCQQAGPGDKKWGVLEARWVAADGSPLPSTHDNGHGMLTAFGPKVNVQEGKRMLGLSSGTARQPSDPGYEDVGGYQSPVESPCPPGFPIESPACNQAVSGTTANDPAGLELRIRVPTNAKSFSFNFNFYTYEWPIYVCTEYNDFFVALLNPANNPQPPQFNNISFDSQGNPVSVNNALLEVCDPTIGQTNPGGKNFPCTLGTGMLTGTGFDGGHAASGWLETVSQIQPGSEMTIRFAVWDAGDHILDSTALIDNFKFSADEAGNTPTTKPVPVPK